jgi:hypothetical protein
VLEHRVSLPEELVAMVSGAAPSPPVPDRARLPAGSRARQGAPR